MRRFLTIMFRIILFMVFRIILPIVFLGALFFGFNGGGWVAWLIAFVVLLIGWLSEKSKSPKVSQSQKERHKIRIVPPENRVNTLILRRNVLDWKDKNVTQIEMHLRGEIPALMHDIEKEVDNLSISELLFKFRKTIDETIQPLFKEWASKKSTQILKEAQKELLSIHNLVLDHIDHGGDIKTDDPTEQLLDTFTSVLQGIGSILLIPVFTQLSVVPVGGLLGWLGVTTVSLPILVIGVVVVSLSLVKMGGLKERIVKRYRDRIRKSIENLVLGGAKSKKPSLCDQLQSCILKASDQIISEIKE